MEFLRKYGVGFTIEVPMIKRAVADFAVGAEWTPASGDVKISKDGGAAANIGTLPAALAMGNGATWQFVVSAAEASCARGVITVADSAAKAVEDQQINFSTFGNASALYAMDLSDTVRLGLTALPNAAAGANGGLPTGNASGQVTVASLAAAATNIKKNTALSTFLFVMTDSTNHNPATGLTVTATRSIDGAAYAGCANSVVEVASGLYKISLATTDTNGNVIDYKFSATGADDTHVTIITDP